MYLDIIKEAIIFFPGIALLIAIPFILLNYHKFGTISLLKTIIMYSFILYLICAYFLIILPLPSRDLVATLTTPKVQLIPFKFIYDFINECNISVFNIKSYLIAFTKSCFYVPIYNIFLTLPFGIYIRYYLKTDLKKTILYSFLLSLFFELTQLTGLYFYYSRGYRLFDIDDLFLNTLGGLIGYYVGGLFLDKIPNTEMLNKKATEKGREIVPSFRKTTSILLDMFLCMFIYFVITIITKNKNLFIWVIISYYFIFPLFFKGRTIAELYLKILIVNNKDQVNIIRTYLRRILFITLYIGLIFVFSILFIKYAGAFNTRIKVLIALIIGSFMLLFYAISIIKFFFIKKRMLYEVISGTKVKSTIK